MNDSQMLHQMCHEVLSNADVKAICKSRGFSAKEAASRALFENFFLSDIGVQAAMAALTGEEIALLHLLKVAGKAVDASFFKRVYDDTESTYTYYHGTFNQRYRDVFRQTKASLVRKGVLLLAEDKQDLNADSKMERWRLRLPQEFERFIPPLFRQHTILAGDGDVRSNVLRVKLMEVLGGHKLSPTGADELFHLRLVDRELRMGGQPFRAGRLLQWQQACWEAALPPIKEERWGEDKRIAFSIMEATTYAFGQLGHKEWLRPDQLSLPLQIFCGPHPDANQICSAGWRWGRLARHKAKGIVYYRLPGKAAETEIEPARYLRAAADRPLVVDLTSIPYADLEYLAQVSDLQVMDSTKGLLTAEPSLVKMGKSPPSVRELPLMWWLREHVPAFRRVLEMVAQRWGRQILHAGLMIARVGDPHLQEQLEKAFPNPKDIVVLPNGYIAFPHSLWEKVQRMVITSGHVIRMVEHK